MDNLKGSIKAFNTYHTDAYMIAVKNGFEGTEAEWLESLKGTPGAPGTPGANGDKGGYYYPGVEQHSTTQVDFTFTPSEESMPVRGSVSITLPAGPRGEKGDAPVRGEDYWTSEDISAMEEHMDAEIAEHIADGISFDLLTNNPFVYDFAKISAAYFDLDNFVPLDETDMDAFKLVEGKTYKVVWNEVEHICKCVKHYEEMHDEYWGKLSFVSVLDGAVEILNQSLEGYQDAFYVEIRCEEPVHGSVTIEIHEMGDPVLPCEHLDMEAIRKRTSQGKLLDSVFIDYSMSYDERGSHYLGKEPILHLAEGKTYRIGCSHDGTSDFVYTNAVCTKVADPLGRGEYWGQLQFESEIDGTLTLMCSDLTGQANPEYLVYVACDPYHTMAGVIYLTIHEQIDEECLPSETWTFELEDGSVVTKEVVVK